MPKKIVLGRFCRIADLTGVTSSFATSLGNAVQVAVIADPTIRGFR